MKKFFVQLLHNNGIFLTDQQLLSESRAQRNGRMVKIASLFFITISILEGLPYLLIYLLDVTSLDKLAKVGLASLTLVSSIIAWKLVNRGRIKAGAWVSISSAFVAVTIFAIVSGYHQPVAIEYLLPILLALLVLDWQGALLVVVLAIASGFFLPIAEGTLHIYASLTSFSPASIGMGWAIGLTVISTMIALSISSFKRISALSLAQNQNLSEALTSLKAQQQVGQSFSQQVLTTSTELTHTASRQSSGSQQQAAALSEISTSLTELTQTASIIAQNARQVAQAMEKMAEGAVRVASTTEETSQLSQVGRAAVSNTVAANQEVGNLYQALVEKLGSLRQGAGTIQTILDLIDGIASETHLLALNAAIEAAGAGQYGLRFSVVAQEVKQLADRAQGAGRDVRKLVQEMENSVTEAVTSVEGGNHATSTAVMTARSSGDVITQLAQVAREAAVEGSDMVDQSQLVLSLCEEIELATRQQQSAGEQILHTLSEVGTVAQENASGSQQISVTARQLEEMSGNLKAALTV